MQPKHLVPILCAGAIAFACSPRSAHVESPRQEAPRRATVTPAPEKNAGLAASIAVDTSRTVAIAFHVVNRGTRRIEITFPNARTHDFAVLDSAGHEMWRWSAGRMFTQSVQNRMLDSRDTISFTARWTPPPEGGTFTAIALLPSSNHPLEERMQFTVGRALTTAAR